MQHACPCFLGLYLSCVDTKASCAPLTLNVLFIWLLRNHQNGGLDRAMLYQEILYPSFPLTLPPSFWILCKPRRCLRLIVIYLPTLYLYPLCNFFYLYSIGWVEI